VSGDLHARFVRSVTWLAGRCQHCVRLGVETASRRDHRLRVADNGLLRLRCIACLALSCAISSVRDDTASGELARWTEPHSSVLLRLSFAARGTCFLLVPHFVRCSGRVCAGHVSTSCAIVSAHTSPVRCCLHGQQNEMSVLAVASTDISFCCSVQTASSCGASVLRRQHVRSKLRYQLTVLTSPAFGSTTSSRTLPKSATLTMGVARSSSETPSRRPAPSSSALDGRTACTRCPTVQLRSW